MNKKTEPPFSLVVRRQQNCPSNRFKTCFSHARTTNWAVYPWVQLPEVLVVGCWTLQLKKTEFFKNNLLTRDIFNNASLLNRAKPQAKQATSRKTVTKKCYHVLTRQRNQTAATKKPFCPKPRFENLYKLTKKCKFWTRCCTQWEYSPDCSVASTEVRKQLTMAFCQSQSPTQGQNPMTRLSKDPPPEGTDLTSPSPLVLRVQVKTASVVCHACSPCYSLQIPWGPVLLCPSSRKLGAAKSNMVRVMKLCTHNFGTIFTFWLPEFVELFDAEMP